MLAAPAWRAAARTGVRAQPLAADRGWAEADAILARIKPPVLPNHEFPVTKYGATGDGARDCTAAFRDAIGVNLHVSEGATVAVSRNPGHYLPVVFTRWEGVELMNYSPLIYAFGQRDTAVTGKGTLDGQACDEHWWPWKSRGGGWAMMAIAEWLSVMPESHPDREKVLEIARRGVRRGLLLQSAHGPDGHAGLRPGVDGRGRGHDNGPDIRHPPRERRVLLRPDHTIGAAMNITRLVSVLVLCVLWAAPASPAAAPAAVVTVKNPLDIARPSETIVLSGAAIRKAMPVEDLRTVHVTDDASGKEVIAQPIDVHDDGVFDEVVFQTDLAASETRTFTLSVGPRRIHTKDQFKAYGRFVRERRDDFAWENDRVAHRMYGKALETWAQEPLTSSAVDVWFKRTRRLVANEWYMVDDYHRDTGEGADLYSAGTSRGCGGNGIWDAGKLYTSANFVDSKVLANGPLRVMFELTYPAFDAAGSRVTEIKRITLDAGHNLNRFESRYAGAPAAPKLQAAGIKRAPASQVAQDKVRGVLRTWEPVKADGSNFGCGVIVDPAGLTEFVEADGNVLAVTTMSGGSDVTYYAGSGWDRSGDFRSVEDWDRHLAQAAQRIRSPLAVSVAAR